MIKKHKNIFSLNILIFKTLFVSSEYIFREIYIYVKYLEKINIEFKSDFSDLILGFELKKGFIIKSFYWIFNYCLIFQFDSHKICT